MISDYSNYNNNDILPKSPQHTWGYFMFLFTRYLLNNVFGFLLFLARLLALACRLPDSMLVDFCRDLDLEFSRSNMEFAISRPKMVRLPRNEKQIKTVNPEGTFCDTVQDPSGAGDMELI